MISGDHARGSAMTPEGSLNRFSFYLGTSLCKPPNVILAEGSVSESRSTTNLVSNPGERETQHVGVKPAHRTGDTSNLLLSSQRHFFWKKPLFSPPPSFFFFCFL